MPSHVGGCIWAVIYPDGSSAGDVKLVSRMLSRRRYALATIPALKELVVKAMATAPRILYAPATDMSAKGKELMAGSTRCVAVSNRPNRC
jgi:hypothetical protein